MRDPVLFRSVFYTLYLTKISPDKCSEATTTSNFFKTWVVKDFLRIIWVNIGRIFVGKLGENCQSLLVFCGYDDWRSDKAENYTRRGTGAPASNEVDKGMRNYLGRVLCFICCED